MGKRRPSRERGAAAVEFALVVPLLLLLVFGIIQYGYMLSFRQSISQAAAEGARAAAVSPGGLSDAEVRARALAAVNDGLGSYGVTCTALGTLTRESETAGTCTISAPQACSSGAPSAQCIKVTLSYTYGDDPLIPTVGLGFAMPDTLAYSTEAQVS